MSQTMVSHGTENGVDSVEVASLETIDYARLVKKDRNEVQRLLKAAQLPGFFYLDLQNEDERETLTNLGDVYKISEEYFEPDEKQAAFEVRKRGR